MATPPASQPTPEKILQIGLGFWASKTLLSAVELGVFTALGDGPLPPAALRSRTGVGERAARDFFDALLALGLLERGADGAYANTADTALFLDRRRPGYIGGILEMANARLYPFWGALTDALRTGRPQNEMAAGGENPFAALYQDPDRLRGFLRAMTGISLGSARAIAAGFPFDRHRVVADIGCAQGGVVGQIALRHPHLRGTGFDLPPVQPVFEEYMAALGLAARVAFHAGDFWADPLPPADVLVLGHILHDGSREEKKRLLAKAFAALPPGGGYRP